MAKNKKYNWWDDPENKKEIERLSWWNHPDNKHDFMLPISVINSDGIWVAATNDETKEILGEGLHGVAQGDTKTEAIEEMFTTIRMQYEFEHERRMRYQCWVPFRKGLWNMVGGKWNVIVGFHFYFRYGKNMKGGWYIPLTKLNISISNEWAIYRKFKKQSATQKSSN